MERTRRYVLVVEDDADFREAFAVLLESHGYGVVEAGNGEEALHRLQSGAPIALILLDLRLPGMNGRAFRTAQLGDPNLAGIPVAVVSGEPDGGVAAAQLGAVAYYGKPVSAKDVDELVALAARYSHALADPGRCVATAV
jgi:CheY-like chemotaxis protein